MTHPCTAGEGGRHEEQRIRPAHPEGRNADLPRPELAPPAGASRTFVLLHGIGVSQRTLRPLHDRLSAAYAVYSLDLPGYAGLPKPGHSLDVAEMAAAIGAVVDRLGLPNVVLVGHSMGSQWAVELAVQRPDLVSHVVAIGPVVDPRGRSAWAQGIALAVDTFHETPGGNAIVWTDYLRAGPRWYFAQLPHMLRYRLEDRVRELTCPLLIVRGARDPVAGADWSRRLRGAAADAALVHVLRSGHLAQHRAPGAVAAAIDTFLRTGSRGMPARGGPR